MYAMMSTIVLTGAVNLTACSSGDEIVDNPDYNPETNTVKTEFTISLPENAVGKTRMTGDIVQLDDNSATVTFRGIDNILLVPYSLGNGDVTSSSSANANPISLTAIDANGLNATSNSKVYADVNLNVGTTNLLIYGKAKDTGTDNFANGTLTRTGLAESSTPSLSDVEFAPVSITESKSDVGTALITALNAVAQAKPSSNLSNNYQTEFRNVDDNLSPDIHHLFSMYKTLTTASSFSVQAIFDDIYTALASMVTTEMQTSHKDTYDLAVAIRAKIDEQRTTGSVALKSELTGYPNDLPDGAVRVAWDASSNEFKAATQMNYGTTLNVATLEKYVYPANLYYWVNSTLKVSNSKQSDNYGNKAWNSGSGDVLSLYDNGTRVGVNTKSVAVTSPLQYGVARLNAKINALSSNTYYDHEGNTVDVTNGFTLTGILIGGQKSVGWDFDVKGTDEFTIYDKTLAFVDSNNDSSNDSTWTVKSGQATSVNHTLALQTAKDASVYVALELVNEGSDFVGADGIIPAGGKFYLVGELNPSQGAGYNANTTGKDRVFTQDFKTIANFTINPGSASGNEGLGKATNGLPDLRESQKELGLSVNLEWQEGLTFTISI